jgi:hypothetical protein
MMLFKDAGLYALFSASSLLIVSTPVYLLYSPPLMDYSRRQADDFTTYLFLYSPGSVFGMVDLFLQYMHGSRWVSLKAQYQAA